MNHPPGFSYDPKKLAHFEVILPGACRKKRRRTNRRS